DLRIESSFIASRSGRHTLKFLAVICDETSKYVQPAGAALGIGAGGDVFRQIQLFEQRHNVNAALFKHSGAREIYAAHAEPEFGNFAFDCGVLGDKTGLHAIAHITQSEIKTGRLDLLLSDAAKAARGNVALLDQVADFLGRKHPVFPAQLIRLAAQLRKERELTASRRHGHSSIS